VDEACFGAPTQQQLQSAAESSYIADHLHCVDTHETKAEIDACRAAVRVKWGIAVTTTDAGRRDR